jgi:hypothetical protein
LAVARPVIGIYDARRDSRAWADHYRARASDYMKRAEATSDDALESQFRFLAQRYLKLAEAEELVKMGNSMSSVCREDYSEPRGG